MPTCRVSLSSLASLVSIAFASAAILAGCNLGEADADDDTDEDAPEMQAAVTGTIDPVKAKQSCIQHHNTWDATTKTCKQTDSAGPAPVCWKATEGRGAGFAPHGTPPKCGAGNELNQGLCYPKCDSGMAGVGPVCWGVCSGTHPVDCGFGCSTSQIACATSILNQAGSVMQTVGSVLGGEGLEGAGDVFNSFALPECDTWQADHDHLDDPNQPVFQSNSGTG
jgi:hypothetical protein